ncbi:bacterio-opsin activator HTH domain-containing protein [Natrinema pellirubrum DSM 15624]|uniref:Bacterio-opsin activator HTH domain-containing protein n=2 Tax=Natrinema TaxID=88723 RepID=L0JKH2_NATP1|nr:MULTISPECIES: helix-turn-helix domain-containing protein [Natrinema]AGB32040.1 putative DNA binding protein [Natrinema pellirubrum DSM 15624]ELY78095.1 bacterio-opsin activator HTH domain-containing protein [Natrinema pellirubrum DSM 15624]QCC60634.1 bacterio-opsin activator [Natrinema thermotolerans]QCC61519.1 bacterio-opsin activator [Natrinema thermotolerans]WMT07676.1 helix-turn-helix domain-containing protein [Natrinema thermotolerans]
MTDNAESNRIRVTVTVTDDESIEQLIDCVDDVVDARTVDDRTTDQQGRPESLQLDVRELTPKQWEALELAGKRGYFDRPRGVDLETLADELAISKSAVSQRLRAAESTLIRAVLDASREPTER